MDARPSYHHGDLERALIAAGLALLEEQGADFSLRELARRAGVSHNAPYKHFADKQAVLRAVGAEGFAALRDATSAAAAAQTGGRAALVASGVAYVRFGRRRPALYRLMFNAMCPASLGEQAAVAREAQDVLRGVLRRGAEEGAWVLDDDRALELALLAAWSLVHGVTQLFLDGYIACPNEAAADGLVTALLDLQLRGQTTQL